MDFDTFRFLFYSVGLGGVAIGVVLFRKHSSWDIEERLLALVVPLGVVTLGWLFLRSFLSSPHYVWNGGRLAPSFALIHGYRLYSGQDVDTALTTVYGPIGPLLYLPATLAESPTTAVLVGELLTLLFFFGPVLLLLFKSHDAGFLGKLVALSCFICFVFFTYRSAPLLESGLWVHADAPGLGLAAGAGIILYLRRQAGSTLLLLLSAVLAVLAVWTKLVFIPVLLGLVGYVWLTEGRMSALRYLLYIAVCGGICLVIFSMTLGAKPMFFNMVTLQAKMPWRPAGKFGELVNATRELIDATLIPMSIVISYAFLRHLGNVSKSPIPVRQWLTENRWFLFAIIGLVLAPMCVWHRAKFNASINALSPTTYFLLIAAILSLAGICSDSIPSIPRPISKAAKLLVGFMVAAFVCISMPPPENLYALDKALYHNSAERAYQYLKLNPGTAYFPDNPLPALMAEGKLYHFSYGVFARDLMHMPISVDQFRAHIPPRVQMIVLAPETTIIDSGYAHPVLRYFPEFTRKSVQPDGSVVYTRPALPLPPS